LSSKFQTPVSAGNVFVANTKICTLIDTREIIPIIISQRTNKTIPIKMRPFWLKQIFETTYFTIDNLIDKLLFAA
jgi:hypothetical protein